MKLDAAIRRDDHLLELGLNRPDNGAAKLL
jgi:hypothetical protein